MWWDFATERAALSTGRARFQPTLRGFWLRQAEDGNSAFGPAYERVQLGRWWASPAAILGGWHPREIPSRPGGRERLQAVLRVLGGAMSAAINRVFEWQERARSRYTLLTLDDRLLKDIGLDRATAHEEGGTPFWRLRD
jgi:uncharacterized protein YjiS (DUF1127 family)